MLRHLVFIFLTIYVLKVAESRHTHTTEAPISSAAKGEDTNSSDADKSAEETSTNHKNKNTVRKADSHYIDWSFPYPSKTFEDYIQRGRSFAQQYLGDDKLRKMKQIVRKIHKNGGSRDDVHEAVLAYLNKALTKEQKLEINSRRKEIQEVFGDKGVS